MLKRNATTRTDAIQASPALSLAHLIICGALFLNFTFVSAQQTASAPQPRAQANPIQTTSQRPVSVSITASDVIPATAGSIPAGAPKILEPKVVNLESLKVSAAIAPEMAVKNESPSKALLKKETSKSNADKAASTKVIAPVTANPALKILVEPVNGNGPQVRVLLIPEKETIISSTIAARIIDLNGALGNGFNEGDVLVAFDCDEAQARVGMSKAELSGAIDQHEAKVKMQGLDQASDVEVSLAASAVNKAKAQLSLNNAQVGQCVIKAPWAGRIAKANVKNNMTVTPGQALLEIVNSGPLKLKLNVPSSYLTKLKVGTRLNVSIDETRKSYSATVSAINSRVDPVSQTVEIEGRLTTSYAELLSGMSGVGRF